MEALIWPIGAIIMMALVWFLFFAKRTRDRAQFEKSLPDDPYDRREAELAYLRQEHEDADPARTTHPARRP